MNMSILRWSLVSAKDWYQVKLFLQHTSGFSMDALHVIIGVVLQRESGCKRLPSLERLIADIRGLAPDGAVLLRSPFGSAGARRALSVGAPREARGGASSRAVVDTLVGSELGRRSIRAQASTSA